MEVIDHQLVVSEAEESRLKALIDDYQRKVEAVPARESELIELTRDYDVLKKTYDSLLVKREDSRSSLRTSSADRLASSFAFSIRHRFQCGQPMETRSNRALAFGCCRRSPSWFSPYQRC